MSAAANKQTHTPTPWEVQDPLGPDQLWIVEADKQAHEWRDIAIVSIEKCDADGISPEERSANAAHIIRCVNSHDANVARIAALEVALRNVIILAEEMRGHIAEACEEPEILTKPCPRIDDACALLAAAKEATP